MPGHGLVIYQELAGTPEKLDSGELEVSPLTLSDVRGVMPSVRALILRPTRFGFTRDRDGVAQIRFQHFDATHVTT